MELEFKDKEQLVQDVITGISEKIADIDFSDGEPLRTIIEAIMLELDKQYWQIEQVYDIGDIDLASDNNLTDLVKILGVIRRTSIKSTGSVKFFRETPAALDYLIPAGTLVETLPDANGNIIQFETTENVTLLTGQTSIYANILAIESGKSGNVVANKIVVINNPPVGIESVVNEESVLGGEEEESDAELRERTKNTLEAAGMGTINALKNKILNMAGVKSVTITDMNRGIGTVDILVLGDTLPMSTAKLDEIKVMANNTKAGGIDVQVSEPSVLPINITATLVLKDGVTLESIETNVNNAIASYFSKLEIGESFILNQLSKEILSNNDGVIDISISSPSSNVTVNNTTIAIMGTINLG